MSKIRAIFESVGTFVILCCVEAVADFKLLTNYTILTECTIPTGCTIRTVHLISEARKTILLLHWVGL